MSAISGVEKVYLSKIQDGALDSQEILLKNGSMDSYDWLAL